MRKTDRTAALAANYSSYASLRLFELDAGSFDEDAGVSVDITSISAESDVGGVGGRRGDDHATSALL